MATSETIPAGISIRNHVLTASAKFTGKKIDLADYPDASKVNAAAVTKNVSIIGTAAANSLKGSAKADTIFGGKGNDTVSLGAGAAFMTADLLGGEPIFSALLNRSLRAKN